MSALPIASLGMSSYVLMFKPSRGLLIGFGPLTILLSAHKTKKNSGIAAFRSSILHANLAIAANAIEQKSAN
jgi:biotin transporter BioY